MDTSTVGAKKRVQRLPASAARLELLFPKLEDCRASVGGQGSGCQRGTPETPTRHQRGDVPPAPGQVQPG